MRMAVIVGNLAFLAIGTTAFAGEERADYGVLVGVSPFGGSLNFSHHYSQKSSWNVAIGLGPALTMASTIDGTEYEVTSSMSWAGALWSHRPATEADWFRIVAGAIVGNITLDIDDKQGNEYIAEYNESPVFYTGVGIGNRPVKGVLVGFDIGMVSSAGTTVKSVENGTRQQLDALNDNWRFGDVMPNLQVTVGYGF